MNADLVASMDASLEAILDVAGVPAQLIPAGNGEPIDLVVSIAELPSALIQMRYGLDDVRMADATLRTSQIDGVMPAHGDVLEVASGAQAGSWVVLGVERIDEVGIVVRLRRSARSTASAPGAKEIRR